MNITTIIYVLIDPRDGSIFYVGRTTMRLNRRLQGHVKDGRRKRTTKGEYIARILADGLRPEIREIESFVNLSRASAIAKEDAWRQFYGITYALYNTGGAELGGHGTNRRVVWTPETIALLGKQTDTYIAELMGCDRKSVEYQREKLGIARCPQTNFVVPPMGGWNRIELSCEVLDQIGEIPDTKLAESANVCVTVIKRYRKELGIIKIFKPIPQEKPLPKPKPAKSKATTKVVSYAPKIKKEPRKRITKSIVVLNPKVKDEKTSKHKRPPFKKISIDLEKLGSMPDYRLAEILGISKRTVAAIRKEKGIASYAEQTGNDGRWGNKEKLKKFLSPACPMCESLNTIRYGPSKPKPQHKCKDCDSVFAIGVKRFRSDHACIFCSSFETYRASRSGKNKNLTQCDNCKKSFRIDN